MEIQTARFGRVEYAAEDVLQFPEGLPGLAECRDWVVLADRDTRTLAWMQNLQRREVALAVVSPGRIVPGYQLRVARREVEPLGVADLSAACVLAIVGRTERGLTLNLQAPLVIDLDRRLGRQVIANGDLPLQYRLSDAPGGLKKSA
jgi:flagellar assembly factor FliW